MPWGISESALQRAGRRLDYQYQSFGVPGLGLKRGLAKDLVVAPYATVLAVMVRPRAALHNLRRLAAEGAEGPYGFYEAIDYTPEPPAAEAALRRGAVLHGPSSGHGAGGAGQSACSNDPMPRRFHAEPMVRATELLLQERMPRTAPLVQPHGDEAAAAAAPGTKVSTR